MPAHSVQQIRERMRRDPVFRESLIVAPLRALQAYTLTEEEKHLFVIPNFRWVIAQQLAGVSYPRSEDALSLLHRLGIRALLCLATKSVSEDLLSMYQMHGAHLSVADFTAPTLEQIERAVSLIEGFLGREMPVAVHCGAGLGRTGTLLACYLVAQGHSASAAILQVRRGCPGSIETSEQEAVIGVYEQIHRGTAGI
jgi:atypical dual specificity phosphatase